MLRKITDLEVNNKRVLVRLDLNLPRKDGFILDYTRIERSLKTIQYLMQKGAKIILISHLGRPKGRYSMDLSLAPIADSLEKLLGKKVEFASDIFDPKLVTKTQNLKQQDILLLENLRFYAGEEASDENFINRLSMLGDCYVNDTFSCSHRKHSSIYGIAKILPSSAGFLLEEELSKIEKILQKPKKPILAIIGGSKVSTKLILLKALTEKVDMIAIGGSMANSFLKAQNIDIGSSVYEKDLLNNVLEILELAKKRSCKIILPTDFIVSNDLIEPKYTEIYSILASHRKSEIVRTLPQIENKQIFDIGPSSLRDIENAIEAANTIIWNGPVGAFETKTYNISSRQIARSIAYATIYNSKISIAGGGDTLAVIKTTGLSSNFSYISTGGGAFLEWLEGKTLPGIEALSN